MGQRSWFREACVRRDDATCVVPWCGEAVDTDPSGDGEIHHIIERKLWDDGGYIPENGACVCNTHHRYAETNYIPPQAFWCWLGVSSPTLPDSVDSHHINKWGEPMETPPWSSLRDHIKYPSTRHLLPCYWQSERSTAEERTERDDTGMTSTAPFVGVPFVVSVKMDGSNAMLVKDSENPVRARNGKHADHESFDMLKQEYWEKDVYSSLNENIQIFGEWMYAKHSIHYGCECDSGCEEPCESTGPPLDDSFYVFGAYDTDYDVWLSWAETRWWANEIGFSMPPIVGESVLDTTVKDSTQEFVQYITEESERIVDLGHEGTIVRTTFPFHYGQFGERVGKFVRPNHVRTDEHWSHQRMVENVIR